MPVLGPRISRRVSRRSLRRSVTVALAGLAAHAACTGGGGAGRGGTVVIAEAVDMDKPIPLVSETSVDGAITGFLYLPLLAPWWENGELHYLTAEESPEALARSYEFFGPDSASLRYRLRTDVYWSDGQRVRAQDVAFTIRARGDERLASPRQDYNREIREVVVEDDSTVVIHFTRRYPEIFFHTAGPPVPSHVYENADLATFRSHPTLVNPVGNLVTNGPFRLAQWVRGQQIVLERNPDFQPQPRLDRIVFRIIPEETTRMIELQTGNVDMTQVPFHYLDEIRRVGGIRIETQEKRSYEYIAYNPRAYDFFADPDIRRALGLAIDVDGMISALQMEPFAVPAGGPYSPIFRRLYDPQLQAPLPYDTVEAKRILAEKGWQPGPDGILRRNGERFSFTLLTNSENRRRIDIAQIVERQWRRIGVEARIQTLEFNTVVERMSTRNYDARIGGWNVGLSPDLYQIWGDPDLPFNEVSYDNPRARELMARATEQPTEEAAAPYWREAASTIVADQPYTWLFYYDTPYGVNDRVKGVVVNTLSAYQRPWEWYIEE